MFITLAAHPACLERAVLSRGGLATFVAHPILIALAIATSW
jgi:hypothetical protein